VDVAFLHHKMAVPGRGSSEVDIATQRCCVFEIIDLVAAFEDGVGGRPFWSWGAQMTSAACEAETKIQAAKILPREAWLPRAPQHS
jgi:hypothetical protein